jgi:hypothetical protein
MVLEIKEKAMRLITKSLVVLTGAVLIANAYAGIDYDRINLPNNTTRDNPAEFYCTVTLTKSPDARIMMNNYAQMVTGFSKDPKTPGQLIIQASQLNQVYFKTYQDPDMKDKQGFVQAIGTPSIDIECAMGNDGRQLMPGDYGAPRK